MSEFFRFPETIFATQNGLLEQISHANSEGDEIADAIQQNESPERIAEEIIDKIHSLETALRILQRDFGIDTTVIAAGVTVKNKARGYYGLL